MRVRRKSSRGQALRNHRLALNKPAMPEFRSFRRGTAAVIFAATSIAAVASSAPAASNVYIWNNSGTDFNTASDWNFNGAVSTVYPGLQSGANTDVADFNTLGTQPSVSGSDTLGELEFDTAGWSLGGSGQILTLNGGTVDATNAGLNVGVLSTPASGTNTIVVGLDIGADQTWEIATGGTLSVSGPVTDNHVLTIGAAGYTGAVIFAQPISYAGQLTVAGAGVTFASGWAPASPYAGVALQVADNGSVRFGGGTTSLYTTNANPSPSGYVLDNIAGTVTVDSGATLNLSVVADSNGSANEQLYVYNGPGATITNNGAINFTGRPTLQLDAGSRVNNDGSMSFGPASGAASGWLLLRMGNGAVFNIGSAADNGASLAVTEPAGMVVQSLGSGTSVAYLNVYGSFSGNASSPASPTSPLLRLGADTAGAQDILTVYSATNGGAPGGVTLNSVALGDNSGGTAVPGILGAIYLQSGTTLNVNSSTAGIGVFSIGAAGSASPGPTGGGGQNNDFGYVYVGPNASIGATYATAEIDIGGKLRSANINSTGVPHTATVGGGNGVMDVIGGSVTAANVGMSDSFYDQQFSALNLVGGTLTLSGSSSNTAALTMAGTSIASLAGIYGSYSVANVINSTVEVTNTNLLISLAGCYSIPTTYQTYLLPTGILNLNGSSTVSAGHIKGGTISVGGTPNGSSTKPPTVVVPDGIASGFINFNGGTLNDNGGTSTFLLPQVAGCYIYSGGGTIAGLGNAPGTGNTLFSGNNVFSMVGLSAPPGLGLTTGTIAVPATSGGSGYVAPPVVLISDPTGFDASGYATVANGQVTGIVITNPGFNMSDPTIQLVGGGGSGASVTPPSLIRNASGPLLVNVSPGTTITLSGFFAGPNGNNGSSSAYETAVYSLTNTYGKDNYNITGTSNSLGVDTSGNELGNVPYANVTSYGYVYQGIRNNTSTYTGATVIESGTMALYTQGLSLNADGSVSYTNGSGVTGGNPTNYAAGAFAATNNNVPFSAAIIVGDTPADAAAVLDITNVVGTGGFQLAPGLVNSSTYGGTTYSYTSTPQVLAGFGTVKGSDSVGLTVGLASGGVTAYAPVTGNGATNTVTTTSTGNNFGGYPYAATGSYSAAPTVNHSVISPGYTGNGVAVTLPSNVGLYQPNSPFGTIVLSSSGGSTTVTFNTRQGNAVNGPNTATGALTIGNNTGTPTTLGAGGTYYWKLDLTNAASGATTTPGAATVSPGLTAGAPAPGVAWDELLLDSLSVNRTIGASTTTGTSANAFTIQAVDFSSQAGNSSFSSSNSYSWVIARVNQPYSNNSAAQLLASLSLNTAAMPPPASGHQYFLSSQPDPGNMAGAYDLVVNYAPVPEPTSLGLLGLGAGTLLLRRRRESLLNGPALPGNSRVHPVV